MFKKVELQITMKQAPSLIIAQNNYVNKNPLPTAVTDKSTDFPFDLLLKISYRMYKEDKIEYIRNITQKKRQQAN